MAVNVTGGGLEFNASIDDSGIEAVLAKINRQITDTYNKQKQAADTAAKQQKEYANIIISTGAAFKSLDSGVQGQLKSLAALNVEYRSVADARKTLDQRFNDGKIGVDTYTGSLAALMNKERELSTAIQTVTSALSANERFMQSANGSITQKMALLDQLKQKYNSLSEIDRNDVNVSSPILGQIQSLDSELRSIQSSFNAVETHALGSINERTAALTKLKSEYQALSEIDRNSDTGKSMLTNIQQVEAEVNRLNSSFAVVQKNAAGSINEKIAQLQKLRTEYAALSETDRKNSNIGGAMLRNIKQLDAEVRKLNTDFDQTSSIASKVAVAIGGYLSLNAASDFVRQLVTVRGEFEQLSVAFTTMLGNKEKADQLMQQAVQLAATTPFTLQDVATGAKQLLAYGTAAEKIPDTLKMLGNVASGVSAPLGDIVYLYGTLQTQGRAYTRDILQFTSRGIPLLDQLAKQFGVTTGQVQELVEAGKVGFPEVQQAFQAMTGSGGMFFNLMEKQAGTVTGMLSNLSDAFDKMLNDIGQSNEGIIKGAISGLIGLVENYQSVIDVLKVLLVSYGSYKAAVLATAAYNAVAAQSVAGYTLAETLRYRAMLLSEGAMKLLNRTMLLNPYVAAATAIAGLVAAFVLLRKESALVKDSQELLANAQQDVGDRMAETEAKIRPYVEALKGANVSENERLNIYNKLKAVDPSIVEGLNAKTISYEALTKNVNRYLDALRNQLALESNGNAVKASIQQEQVIQKQIDDAEKLKKSLEDANKKNYNITVALRIQGAGDNLADLQKQLEQQRKVTESLGKTQIDLSKSTDTATASQKRTVEVIDAQISEQKKLQQSVSATSAEWKKYQDQIDALQKEREAITGPSQQQLKAQQGEETKINTLLNERESILERLTSLQRDANQSGLLQDQSEVDKIREKYDQAIDAIEDYNKKVADFNKKNKANVIGISLDDINTLKAAEIKEVANTIYKQDSDSYLAALDNKKQAFEDFQKIQQTGNEEQIAFARKNYQAQIGIFDSYLDYLKDQQSELKVKLSIEPDNVGLQRSILEVNRKIVTEQNKQQATALQQQIESFDRLYAATNTYNSRRKQIDVQYNKDVALLAQQYNGRELQERINNLSAQKQAAIDAAKDEAFQKTDVYKELNEQIIVLSKDQIRAEMSAINTILAKGIEMPDSLRQELAEKLKQLQSSLALTDNQNYIDVLEKRKQKIEEALATGKLSTEEFRKQKKELEEINVQLAEATDKGEAFAKRMENLSSDILEVSGAISNLASSLSGQNEGLSDTLQTVSDIGNVLGNAAGAAGDFATGNIAGGITKTINAIAGIFAIGAKARESERKAQAELKKYQDDLIKGEISYNQLLRDRLRTQGDITDMTIRELQTRQRMLELQKEQAQADYDRLLKQIQDTGNQVTGERTEKYGGFLGIGRKTRVVQDLAGLDDANYDQLEKLFTEGKLDDATADWFKELQQVHDELEGIGETAEDVRNQLNQVLTGTTADNIADSIRDGLARGYDSFSDFSDDINQLLTNAILSAFSANVIKPQAEQLYQLLASLNDDGILTQAELDQFEKTSEGVVNAITQEFDQLKQLSNLNLTGGSNSTNAMEGALRSMTEQTAELLAGQFGAVRITNMEILQVNTQQLNQLVLLTNYAADIPNIKTLLQQMNNNGIKIRP